FTVGPNRIFNPDTEPNKIGALITSAILWPIYMGITILSWGVHLIVITKWLRVFVLFLIVISILMVAFRRAFPA
ncbi:MAG: hypothetical protein NT058_00180, partial [Candidatus Portnoybacteria bacterium]|nr:hypothetical protein [Candidatus Portnoybacteria bacterium]